MMKKTTLLFALVFGSTSLWSQDADLFEDDGPKYVAAYNGTRVINGHSTEMLEKNQLEFRISHRFGDMLPNWDASELAQSWLGFDQAADIRFGFEYGITENIMIGIGRSKGAGTPYRALLDGFAKYRILRQQEKGMPISLTAVGTMNFTYMKASDDLSQVSSFPEWQHRLAYSTQLNISKKFGDHLSLSLSPTVVHRNYVAETDKNTVFALGAATRIGVSKKIGIILEYFYAFRGEPVHFFDRNNPNIFRNSLALAVEFKTFGHNFTINLTNSRGFGDVQYITSTNADWLLGQFRLGFTIGRTFDF